MNQYFVMLKENARSLKNVRVIVGVALFFALNVILNLFGSIQITNQLKIGFASIATAASCLLYGPIPNLVLAPLLDLVNYMVKPVGAYYPIFMISTMASACIFSAYFYNCERITWVRVILCRITYDVVVSLFLNTLFTSMLWGTPFLVIASPKLIKAKGEPLIGPPFLLQFKHVFFSSTNWTYIIIWFTFKIITIIYISTNTAYPLFFFSVCRCFCRCALF